MVTFHFIARYTVMVHVQKIAKQDRDHELQFNVIFRTITLMSITHSVFISVLEQSMSGYKGLADSIFIFSKHNIAIGLRPKVF